MVNSRGWPFFGVVSLVCMAIASSGWNKTGAIASAQSTSFEIAQRQLNCTNPQSQAEMNICAGEQWQASDRELNRVYQSLTPNLSNSRREKLVDAQLAWIEFRDLECEFESSKVEGGSMQPMVRSGCRAELTEQRTTDLYQYSQGENPSAFGSSYQNADNRLNSVYQQLLRKLSRSRQEKLKDAELAWIEYRDAVCEFERSGGGNAGYDTCMIRLTEERTNQLEEHLRNARSL